jgi:hypothetical protein
LCGCTTKVIAEEDRTDVHNFQLDAIAPERSWREARKEFFSWPQTAVHFVIYGLYRREALLKTPLGGRKHRGRPVVLDMEFPILANLSNHGRIVALPDMERIYRSSAYSACSRDVEELSVAAQFWLALRTRGTLLKIAAKLKAPAREKWELIRLTLNNFRHHHLGRLPEFRANLRHLRTETGMLRAACEERLAAMQRQEELIQSMKVRIEELEQELRSRRVREEKEITG